MAEADPLAWLHQASDDQLEQFIAELNEAERQEWQWDWSIWGRRAQHPPQTDWRIWLVMAGRGFGKTRTGAEWVNAMAEANPEARIALVGASLIEARAVMVEGESGLLSIGAPWRRPSYESSLRRLIWPSGAQAFLYSAGEPEALRGPQHSHAFWAGPDGNHGERGPHVRRPPAARHGRRRTVHAPVVARCGSGLASRQQPHRCLHRTHRTPCRMERWRMEIPCAN